MGQYINAEDEACQKLQRGIEILKLEKKELIDRLKFYFGMSVCDCIFCTRTKEFLDRMEKQEN